MALVPRSQEQIFDDMVAFIQAQTNLTDFEIGSSIRTILEAASLEDDEQYFQMVQLLEAFDRHKSTGTDLDARLAEFNLIRLQPNAAAGQVTIQDNNLVTSFLSFDEVAGSTSFQLVSTTSFPVPGPVFTIRIGEGTSSVEETTCSINNTVTNILTVVATVNPHSAGDRVSLVDGAADMAIAPSIQVQVPSVGGAAPIRFVTVEGGTIVNGDYNSSAIQAKAVLPGSSSNVGVERVTQFTAAPPFTGAGVINLTPFNGGRDVETDPEFNDRADKQIQSLSRGTILALQQAALGVSDTTTGQRVVSVSILEDFILDEVIVYIDDGTGFTPDTVELARTTLTVAILLPVAVIDCASAANFPTAGFIIVSPENAAQIELLEYNGIVLNQLQLVGLTALTHDIGDEVILVDLVEPSAEAGSTRLQTTNFPIVRNSESLWIDSGAFPVLQAGGDVDYFLNRASGEIQLVSGLAVGARVAVTYTYYTGLVQQVQRVLDGDVNDNVNFPGYVAAGIIALVETPVINRITVVISITAAKGFQESDLVDPVRIAVETYINSLGIGADVIKSEIIEQAMGVTGVFNVTVITPASDIVVFENELPLSFSASGDSLVTVT